MTVPFIIAMKVLMEVQYDRYHCSTVNSEIFARILFSRNFAYAKFRKKNPRKMVKSLCHLLVKVNHVIVANFTSQIF